MQKRVLMIFLLMTLAEFCFGTDAWITTRDHKEIFLRNIQYIANPDGDLWIRTAKSKRNKIPFQPLDRKNFNLVPDTVYPINRIDWIEVFREVPFKAPSRGMGEMFGWKKHIWMHVVKVKFRNTEGVQELVLLPAFDSKFHDTKVRITPTARRDYVSEAFFVGEGDSGKIQINVQDVKKIQFK